jgi:hypothetical protein
MRWLTIVAALVMSASCNSGGLGAGSDGGAHVPVNHRPSDAQCTTTPGPGSCNGIMPGSPNMCGSDATCTSGTNGRCSEIGGGAPSCRCTYDTCQHDTDCPTGQLCACHGSALLATDNTCYPGNCRVDSDCGTNGYCSPSTGMSTCGGLVGYYCHTRRDTCTNDSDCNSSGNVMVCEFTTDRWTCQQALLCA